MQQIRATSLTSSLVFFVALSACAIGTPSAEEHGDGAPPIMNSSKDASAPQKDSGTSFEDVWTPEQDASTPTVDASNTSSCAATGTLATFDFTGQPGNQTSTPAKSTMAGVTAGSVGRATTITATAGTDSINGSNWSTAKLDTSRYYVFSIQPTNGCALDIASIAIDTKSSGTGPAAGAIATSADNFQQTTTFTANSQASISLSVSGATGSLEVRVYGYTATSAAGTMRIQNMMTVTGSLQ